jgi:hypothetical protein
VIHASDRAVHSPLKVGPIGGRGGAAIRNRRSWPILADPCASRAHGERGREARREEVPALAPPRYRVMALLSPWPGIRHNKVTEMNI